MEERRNLTQQEKKVLERVAKGMTRREIGKDLNIAEKTVESHLANINNKLNSNNSTESVVTAIKLGLIEV